MAKHCTVALYSYFTYLLQGWLAIPHFFFFLSISAAALHILFLRINKPYEHNFKICSESFSLSHHTVTKHCYSPILATEST